MLVWANRCCGLLAICHYRLPPTNIGREDRLQINIPYRPQPVIPSTNRNSLNSTVFISSSEIQSARLPEIQLSCNCIDSTFHPSPFRSPSDTTEHQQCSECHVSVRTLAFNGHNWQGIQKTLCLKYAYVWYVIKSTGLQLSSIHSEWIDFEFIRMEWREERILFWTQRLKSFI